MSSFHIPLDTFRATCGWKRRVCNHFVFLLVSLCLLSQCVKSDHEETPGCSRENREIPSDCSPGETFDNSTCTCMECRRCDRPEMYEISACTLTHNTECGCRTPTFYHERAHECFISCEDCPHGLGCNDDFMSCKCRDPSCHPFGDIYCRDETRCNDPLTTPTTQPTQPKPNPFDQETFPAWGIGLIAIGIVIGIIIFASCFLCMGLFSMHRKGRDPESQGSEGSENGLVVRESFGSVGTNSSYLSSNSLYPYLTNQNMLELLKSSNSQLVKPNMSKMSSLQSSPVSSRSSPKPGRTVKLTKNPDSKKLTAIL